MNYDTDPSRYSECSRLLLMIVMMNEKTRKLEYYFMDPQSNHFLMLKGINIFVHY